MVHQIFYEYIKQIGAVLHAYMRAWHDQGRKTYMCILYIGTVLENNFEMFHYMNYKLPVAFHIQTFPETNCPKFRPFAYLKELIYLSYQCYQ